MAVTDNGLKTSEFDYDLPPELIAQEPLEDRTAARMMLVNRHDESIRHAFVRDLPAFLKSGDLLVVNDTRVIPARIHGQKAETGGHVELLLLEELASGEWEALCGSSRRPRVGIELVMAGGRILARVTGWKEGGRVTVALRSERPLVEVLEEVGVPPLPPYIKRARERAPGAIAHDREYYQTVYARVPGAVAAPTAGLHLTPGLLDQLSAQGVDHASVTLHVGMGTFKPVTVEDVAAHCMEPERFTVPESAAAAINRTRAAGGRVVAVGSTTVRTLEHSADEAGVVQAGQGRTGIFIHPPYRFRVVDMMLTNFHLPASTLVMMVSALAGQALIRRAYDEAIRERYRFYSYGDCMLIL
jgi:S-adenosylmethionine:tRNA ribosyltransferase-isomerase